MKVHTAVYTGPPDEDTPVQAQSIEPIIITCYFYYCWSPLRCCKMSPPWWWICE